MKTVVEFKDRPGHVAHQEFQEWRETYPDGYYLAFRGAKTAILHVAQGCHHPGNTSWTYEQTGESLTKKRKVCADNKAELLALARKEGVAVSLCAHC